jgi:hypothetical protein
LGQQALLELQELRVQEERLDSQDLKGIEVNQAHLEVQENGDQWDQ